jgi:hypothetical protein
MKTYTPGPWSVGFRKNKYRIDSDDSKPETQICKNLGLDKFEALSVGTRKGQVAIIPLDESNEANARLIAACPVMYNFIKKKSNEGDKKAQAIVAQAEGR